MGDGKSLALTDRQVQQAGVRTAKVARRDLAREIDAVGKLEMNHERHVTISSWIPGKSRIVKLHRWYTGDRVEKGQTLVELYSPMLITSLEEYRLALAALRETKQPDAAALAKASRQRLEAIGLLPQQIAELVGETSDAAIRTIAIKSPFAGTLLEPAKVKEGGYVSEGAVMFQIADLSRLWLFVEIYEYELPLVAVGTPVEIAIRAQPGRTIEGKVAFIEPMVQAKSRTVRLRVVIDNPEGKLMPGMFARARIRARLPGLLAVPESAVLRSGRRDVAILAEGGGQFRPRVVRVGRRYLYPAEAEASSLAAGERYHEVLEGLAAGERVVVAGNFLLNAEAQFQGILKKMLDAADTQEKARRAPEAVTRAVLGAIDDYIAAGRALFRDRPAFKQPAQAAAGRLAEARRAAGGGELGALLGRLEQAARALAGAPGGDLKAARKRFGGLSKEVVAFLRDHAAQQVEQGKLFVFRCPMAGDFGFDLWVQREPKLANPYMGQAMPG